jgi:hypothetical protein
MDLSICPESYPGTRCTVESSEQIGLPFHEYEYYYTWYISTILDHDWARVERSSSREASQDDYQSRQASREWQKPFVSGAEASRRR